MPASPLGDAARTDAPASQASSRNVDVPHPVGRASCQARYGGPEVLHLARRPVTAPAAGQVRVRVHAASLNARDWHVMRGEPRVARLLDRAVFARRAPREPVRGTDFAGVVDAVGDGVTDWAVGDRVFGEGSGTFADYAVASQDQIAALPARVSFAEAATLPLAASTALLCLDEAGLTSGGSVLINGASGGVGTFTVQVAKARGLHVTAVVRTRNADLAESLGADDVIDYTVSDFTRAGCTHDAVVDLVGNRTLRQLWHAGRRDGRGRDNSTHRRSGIFVGRGASSHALHGGHSHPSEGRHRRVLTRGLGSGYSAVPTSGPGRRVEARRRQRQRSPCWRT